MIDRERLKELMKQNATIYGISKDNEIIVIHSQYIHHPKKFGTNIEIKKILNIAYVDMDENTKVFEVNEHNVFETKEEAEWYLEFGNITRTETLSLPNYTVAINYIDTEKFILADNSSFKFLLLSNPNNIIIINKQNGNQIFSKPLTKENYIEACEKAKELFLEE